MKVRFFKLNNGEEFIARLVDEDPDIIVIEEPVVIGPGQGGMSIIPWCIFANNRKMNIQLDQLMFMSEVDSDLERQYTSAYDSFKAKRLQKETGIIITPPNESRILV
jgi:hypothetical protein